MVQELFARREPMFIRHSPDFQRFAATVAILTVLGKGKSTSPRARGDRSGLARQRLPKPACLLIHSLSDALWRSPPAQPLSGRALDQLVKGVASEPTSDQKALRKLRRRAETDAYAKVARFWANPKTATRMGYDRPINRQAAKDITRPANPRRPN